MKIGGAVLAAGDSERMGRPKALLPYEDTTFLGNAIGALQSAGVERIVVITGRHHHQIESSGEAAEARLIQNPDPSRGQLSSLKCALESLDETIEAAIMWLVDHPGVRSDTVKCLVQQAGKGADLVRPVYNGRNGHPLLIMRRVFESILALPLERGLKPMFVREEVVSMAVGVDDPAVLRDIDRPEDYRELSKQR